MEGAQIENTEEGKKCGKRFGLSNMKKENFVVVLLVGVLLLVVAWPVDGGTKSQEQSGKKDSLEYKIGGQEESAEEAAKIVEVNNWQGYVTYLEQTLEGLLSTMEGAGKVKVMITLKDYRCCLWQKWMDSLALCFTEMANW